jgi:hypothetical protein
MVVQPLVIVQVLHYLHLQIVAVEVVVLILEMLLATAAQVLS